MTLITPANAIELVLSRKTKSASFKPYETTIQKWCLILAIILFSAGMLFALTTYFVNYKHLKLAALLSILVAEVFGIAYQIATIVPELLMIRNIERAMSNPLMDEFNNDLDLINQLAQTFDIHHLSFAKTNFTLMAKQLRERIGILVGALEKVGLIPIATTAYFAFLKFKKAGIEPFNGIDWVFAGFVFLYIFSVRMAGTAQWMERVSNIYDQAIALKLKHEQR